MNCVTKSKVFVAFCALVVLGVASACFAEEASSQQDVQFKTKDGFVIHGTYTEGTLPGCILFLHMLGGSRSDWDQMADHLNGVGYHLLAIDLRGHGKSVIQSKKERAWRSFTPIDYMWMTEDVDAALKYLKKERGILPGRVGVVAASIGCNAAINYVVENPGIRTLVLLSPGFNYRGVTIEKSMKKLAGLSLLIVAGKDDDYSMRTSKVLNKATGVPRELLLLENAGHGTRMLKSHPDLMEKITEWIREYL